MKISPSHGHCTNDKLVHIYPAFPIFSFPKNFPHIIFKSGEGMARPNAYLCRVEIYKQFNFEAAHSLPMVPDGHQCKGIHGHSYVAKVVIDGPIDPHMGWVIDFADVKKAVKPVIDRLDHQYINELEGLENPTCERIAQYIWEQVKPSLPLLKRIELQETPTSGVIYCG